MTAGSSMSDAQDSLGPEFWEDLGFADVPDLQAGNFRHSPGALEGFESYMDLTPNASTESFAAHGFAQSATPSQAVAAAEPEVACPSSAGRGVRTKDERKQFSNRMSQKRFRQRQKASAPSRIHSFTWLFQLTSQPLLHCRIVQQLSNASWPKRPLSSVTCRVCSQPSLPEISCLRSCCS